MSSTRICLVASLLGFLVAGHTAGQIPTPTGDLYGTVLDEQGSPLAGVAVRLTGPGSPRLARTDRSGDFHFLKLSPASYAVSFQLSGFETVRRDVDVELGKDAVISITMPVAGAVASVVARAETSDTRKVETGATYEQQELQSIPTTRDPWAILRQVPGVLVADVNVGGRQSAQQSGFVGEGAHPNQNLYTLDGVAVSINGITPIYFDFDSLDSIGVSTGGSDPELSTPGVTLNLSTRRGTNELKGSGRALYTDRARWDYGVEAGGPVWKDHLWLWASGARNTYLSQTFFLPTGEPTSSQETQDYWNAKLSADFFPGNSLTLAFSNFNRLADGRGAGPNRSQESTWNQTFPSSSYRVEDSQVLSRALFASLSFAYLNGSQTSAPRGGDVQADYIDGAWRNSFTTRLDDFPQQQAGASSSAFFDTGSVRHELKVGFGYRAVRYDSAQSWPADELVGYGPPYDLANVTRAYDARYETRTLDAYAQDTVQAERLTLNLGVRFDDQESRNLPSAVAANPVFPDLLPAVSYPGDPGYPIGWRSMEPRVSATYALGADGRTLARASYARFANQLADEVSSANAFPGFAYLYYGWNDANGNGRVEPGEVDLAGGLLFFNGVDPSNPGSSTPVNQISKGLRPPTTDEVVLGFDRQISPALSASVSYTHRRMRDLEFSPLIGTTRDSYAFVGNASGVAVDPASGFELAFREPYYRLVSCPAPCAGTILRNQPDFDQTYDGVALQLFKRLSHGWMFRAAFAYNDWRQRVGTGALVDPNNLLGGTTRSGPVVETSAGAPYLNARWQLNVSGMVELPLGIDVSGNLYARQGFPVLYSVQVATHDVSPQSNPDIQIGSPTAYRLGDVVELDLQVEKSFSISGRAAVALVLDCFNVANSRTILTRDGNAGFYDALATPAFAPSPDFNAPGQAMAERVFRGGVRLAF